MLTECSTSRRHHPPSPTSPALPGLVMPSALVKAVIVNTLEFILAWHPTIAMLLGRLIFRCFPWLREA